MAAPELNGHRRIESREQAAAEALMLQRERGLGVRDIAEELTARGWQIGKTQAAELVKEARAQEPFIDLLDRVEARKDQADRLRSYHQIMIEELRTGRVDGRAYVETMLKVEERWARLGGLDAPKHLEVTDRREEPHPDMALLRELRLVTELAEVCSCEEDATDPTVPPDCPHEDERRALIRKYRGE